MILIQLNLELRYALGEIHRRRLSVPARILLWKVIYIMKAIQQELLSLHFIGTNDYWWQLNALMERRGWAYIEIIQIPPSQTPPQTRSRTHIPRS